MSSKQLLVGLVWSCTLSKKHQPFSNSGTPWSLRCLYITTHSGVGVTYVRGGIHPPLGFPSSPLVTGSSVHLHPFISSDVLPSGQIGATFTLVSDGASSRTTFNGPALILSRTAGADVPLIHSPSTLNRTPSLHSKSEENL